MTIGYRRRKIKKIKEKKRPKKKRKENARDREQHHNTWKSPGREKKLRASGNIGERCETGEGGRWIGECGSAGV